MSTQLTPDDAKRLLACMQLGVLIQHEDGHRWIAADGTHCGDGVWEAFGLVDTTPLNRQLRNADLDPLDRKQYGSLRSCFDVIDAALLRLGSPTLRELYDTGGDHLWGFDG